MMWEFIVFLEFIIFDEKEKLEHDRVIYNYWFADIVHVAHPIKQWHNREWNKVL